MSAYHEYETVFNDQDCLVGALEDLGFKPKVSQQAQSLEGYQGDKRNQKAEIIIPRRQVGGASNDIGFKRTESGKFTAVISEYDRHRYGKSWEEKLKQKYQERNAVKIAQRQGARLVRREEVQTDKGKRVRLVFSKAGGF